MLCGVGLRDRRIADQDISASLNHSSPKYRPEFARLDKQGTANEYGGWAPCGNPCGKQNFSCCYFSYFYNYKKKSTDNIKLLQLKAK